MEACSYIFSVFLLISIFIFKDKKGNFFGINVQSNGITSAWIVLFFFNFSYMFSYMGYNFLIDVFIFVIYLMIFSRSRVTVPYSYGAMMLYSIFFLWCLLRLLGSESYEKGVMMAIKLSYPIVFFMYAWRAFVCRASIWVFFDTISKLSILYFVLSIISISIEEYFQIYPYFGMSIFPCCLVMWLRTQKKKYLFFILLTLSHNIVEIKRTPLLAIVAMLGIWLFFKYRLKAIIPTLVILLVFLISILYIPALNERMFFAAVDPQDIDWSYIFSSDFVSMINSNGRFDTWEMIMNKFYKGNEYVGCGLGTMKGWLVSPKNTIGAFTLLHNDWIHLLCEVGLIGVFLLLLFFAKILNLTYRQYQSSANDDKLIALATAMTVVGTACHMFFENCLGGIGYSLPAIYLASFYKNNILKKVTIEN